MSGDGIVEGDGFTVAPHLDAIGEGYGFRKVRQALGVNEFGANVIVMPPSYETSAHYHDEQEELYFVHRGRIEMTFGDGNTHELAEGGSARVAASTHRKVRNPSDTDDAVYMVIGAKGGYIGRDGRTAEGESA